MSFFKPTILASCAIALVGLADRLISAEPYTACEPDTLEHAIHSTYKIKNKGSTATCFLVKVLAAGGESRLVLVTAGHVLRQAVGEQCRLVLRKRSANGTLTRDEYPIRIRAGKKTLWVKHPKADVAALLLELPAEHAACAFPLSQLADTQLMKERLSGAGQTAFVLCYPAQLEAHPAGLPVLRRGTLASDPRLSEATNGLFLMDYSAFKGDSGAPVVVRLERDSDQNKARLLVVGMVIGHHRESTKMASHVFESTIHMPLGLGMAVTSRIVRDTVKRAVRMQN